MAATSLLPSLSATGPGLSQMIVKISTKPLSVQVSVSEPGCPPTAIFDRSQVTRKRGALLWCGRLGRTSSITVESCGRDARTTKVSVHGTNKGGKYPAHTKTNLCESSVFPPFYE